MGPGLAKFVSVIMIYQENQRNFDVWMKKIKS